MTIGLGQAKPSMIIQQLIGDQDRNSFQMFYPVSQLDLNGAQTMTIGLGQAKPSMIIQQLIGDQDRNSFQMFYPVSQLNLKMEKGTGTTDHVRIQVLKLQAPYACRILPTSARRLMGALHHQQLPLLKVKLLLPHL